MNPGSKRLEFAHPNWYRVSINGNRLLLRGSATILPDFNLRTIPFKTVSPLVKLVFNFVLD